MGSAGHVPYRQSDLTRLLKDAFVSSNAVSAVIATVSPSATDTEHSLDTLHHATLMASSETQTKDIEQDVPMGLASWMAQGDVAYDEDGGLLPMPEKPRVLPPVRWSSEDVQEWLQKVSGGKAWMPAGIDGQQLVRMAKSRFTQACGGDQEMGLMLFETLQAEVKLVNKKRVADAKASRTAQQEHRHTAVAQKAGAGRPAPANPVQCKR